MGEAAFTPQAVHFVVLRFRRIYRLSFKTRWYSFDNHTPLSSRRM